jgi:hypothetical protein
MEIELFAILLELDKKFGMVKVLYSLSAVAEERAKNITPMSAKMKADRLRFDLLRLARRTAGISDPNWAKLN